MRLASLSRKARRFVLETAGRSLSAVVRGMQEERGLLQQVLDDMQEGVLVLDTRGKVLRANPSARKMLGISGSVDKGLGPFVDTPELCALLEDARRARGSLRPTELEISGRDGRRVLLRASPMTGKKGAILAVLVDVTDVRRLETMRRDFVANVSHELRTPVTVVVSAVETLRDVMDAGADPSDLYRFIGMLDRNAHRLRSIVDDLLELSRIEARELRLNMQPVDVAEAFESVVATFGAVAADRGSVLTVRAGEDCLAFADKIALERVLTNLVDNAMKYAPGAAVSVRATRNPTSVVIVVADTGAGIEARHLPRLFERFYRVDTARSRELGGTGLGLAIVKHLVEAMGGSVAVSSTVSVGTAFTVVLPRWTETHDPALASGT